MHRYFRTEYSYKLEEICTNYSNDILKFYQSDRPGS